MGDTIPGTLDLFAPQPEEQGILPGTIDGPLDWQEGFDAGLRVWCGAGGWRPFEEVITSVGCLMFYQGRLSTGISWDLEPHKNPRLVKAQPEEEGDG